MVTDVDRSWWRSRFARVLILALVYFIAGKLGLQLALINKYASAVWPPSGLALAALLLWDLEVWPGVLLGAFFVNVTTGNLSLTSILVSAGIASGNTLTAITGAYLVKRWANGAHAFDRVRDVLSFVLFAAFLSTAIGATVGATSLSLTGLASWAKFPAVWLTWWIGDAAGDLVFAPVVLLWAADHHLRWNRRKSFDAALSVLLVVAVAISVFTNLLPPSRPFLALAFLGLTPLLWIVFRFGQREVASAILLLSAIAIWGATHGLPRVLYNENEGRALINLQEYISMSSILFLILAAEVSTRKRHEHAYALQAMALAQYARLVDLGPLIVRDAQDRITQWTSGAERLYGYTREEAVGQTSGALFHTRFPEPPERIHAKLLAEGRWEGELIHTTRDGREIVVASLQVLHRGREGEPADILEINNDITMQKRAESALRESEEHLRFALSAAGMHDWEWDLKTMDFVRSENAQKLWGLKDASGETLMKMIDPGDFERLKQAAANAIASRAPFEVDHRITRADGEPRWLLSRATVRYGPDNRPLSIVGISLDISERRKAERRIGAQLAIARILAESPSLGDAAPKILPILGKTLGRETGILWIPDGNELRCLHVWHDPSLRLDNFASTSAGARFTRGMGLPGRVWASGKASWLLDLAEDDHVSRALVAMSEGLRAAVAYPVLLGKQCLGVMEFCGRHVQAPDENQLAMMDVIGGQIAHFMEHRRTETALQESEARLNLALVTARTYAWHWDLVTGRATHSENVSEILGFEPASVDETWQAIHPEDRIAMKRAYAGALRSGMLQEIDLRIIRPQGEIRWISTRAEVRHGPDGQPQQLAGVAVDITERKRAEENLRLTLESAPNAIVVLGPEGRIAFVNARTEASFGYSRDELLGQPVEILIPGRLRRENGELRIFLLGDSQSGPTGATRELRGLRKDGSEFPIDIQLSPFHTEQGTWLNLAISDITERKRIERERTMLLVKEQALAAQRQLTEIVANAADFVKMADAQGRVIYLNPAGRKMIGLSGEESISDTQMKDYYPEWAWEVIRTVALPEAERDGFWTGELALKCRDVKEIPVSQTIVSHHDSDGALLGYSSIARDISDRKKAERAIEELAGRLIHAQEEERGRIGRELHDHVSQMLALVAMQLDFEDRPDLARVAKQAADDVRHLSHRLHSSTLEDFGLVTTLNELANEFRERRGLEIDLKTDSLPPGLPREIDLCLLRIVEECLNNIARHSGAKSSRVELKVDRQGIFLRIQDDGIGFDPSAAQESGGLGLVSIRERLRLVQGELRIHSRPFEGSRIEVSIPTGVLNAKGNDSGSLA